MNTHDCLVIRDPRRGAVDVYFRQRVGGSTYWLDGLEQNWRAVVDGTEPPKSFSLPDELWQAVIEQANPIHERSESVLREAWDDAKATRDRLLSVLERTAE